MHKSPSLVRQPGWILGVAGVMTAAPPPCVPHAQTGTVRVVSSATRPNHLEAIVIRTAEDSTMPGGDSFAITNSSTGSIEPDARRAAGRR
jgi:hypothetical protein